MTMAEQLKHDIDTLMNSINLDWWDMASKSLSADERAGIRKHIDSCIKELAELIKRLDAHRT